MSFGIGNVKPSSIHLETEQTSTFQPCTPIGLSACSDALRSSIKAEQKGEENCFIKVWNQIVEGVRYFFEMLFCWGKKNDNPAQRVFFPEQQPDSTQTSFREQVRAEYEMHMGALNELQKGAAIQLMNLAKELRDSSAPRPPANPTTPTPTLPYTVEEPN